MLKNANKERNKGKEHLVMIALEWGTAHTYSNPIIEESSNRLHFQVWAYIYA